MNRDRASILGVLAVTIAVALSGCGRANSAMQRDGNTGMQPPPPSTPDGVSLVDVSREMGASQPEFLWTRIGDAQANTLLISASDTQPGKSNCTGECEKEFPPFIASADAKAFGDWALVKRDDGKLQWAYQSKPLYRYPKETKLGELVDNVVIEEGKKGKSALSGGSRRQAKKDDKPPLLPPEGWSIARFNPGGSVTKPPGIDVRPIVVESGTGVGLVTLSGMTLYGYNGSAEAAAKAECADGKECLIKFAPALVPGAFTGKVGEFATIERKADDARQWTFRGVPLYTFSGDAKAGDANGVYGGDGSWQAVLLSMDGYPESVRYVQVPVKGAILTTGEAKPLYNRAAFESRWGGFTTYQGYSNSYRMGTAVRTGACNAECLKKRIPLAAPTDARTRGYWMALERPDGKKQWSYKGFALYSYIGDDSPGIVTGSNVTDYVVGDDKGYKIAEFTEASSPGRGMGLPAGFYWYVARP